MMWTCPACNRSYQTNDKRVRCICSCQRNASSTVRQDYLPCLYRGSELREINCGCSGKPKIYECSKHGEAYLRKLPKMPPESIAGYTMCLTCDDRQRYEPGPLGVAGIVHNKIGGTETYWRMLHKQLGIAGFATPEKPRHRSSHYPVFGGDEAIEELASKVEILLVWGLVGKDEVTKGPIRIAMHHGSLASTWANTVFEDQLKWCEKAAAINRDAADHYGVECIENCVDIGRLANAKKPTDKKTVLWLHRDASEKRPWLARKIAEQLPEGWRMIASLPKDKAGDNLECIGQVEDVAYWHSQADVFLSTADQEGFGYSVAEAMAIGVPVVSGPFGLCENPDLCEQVTTDNPADWVHAILGAGAKAEYARQYVKQRYGIDQWTNKWIAYLEGLLK